MRISRVNEVFIIKMDLEKKLKTAIENEEFFLVYQPQLDLLTEKVSGIEALIRWDLQGGVVPPGEFIPAAEELGLIIPIGQWVLNKACSQIREWILQGIPVVPVSVNISSAQLKNEGFYDDLCKVLEVTGIQPELLELEITESICIDSFDTVRELLCRIRKLGVRIALDDFGTGYSSLNYIKNLPLDVLKIDKSFIDDIISNPSEKAIIGTIIQLAHILNLEVVAEGVETKTQYDYLKKIGCCKIQGFYFSKPKSPDEIEIMLVKQCVNEILSSEAG